MLPLDVTQLSGPSTAVALQQPFIAMLIPSTDPSVDASAIHLQALRDLTGGPPLDAKHDGLQSQGHAGCFLSLRFLAKSLQPSQSSQITLGEDGLHHQKR